MAFQEYDLPPQIDFPFPPSALWDQAWGWIVQAFQQAGVELQMGMKLHSTFLQADLPAPQLRYEAFISTGSECAELVAETVRDVLPLILKFGLAGREVVGIETLTKRLYEEAVMRGGVTRTPALISAWTRIP